MDATARPAYGVIARNERLEPALAAGVDYVDPIILGTLVVPDREHWARNPDYRGPERAPSFAILVPAEVKLSDPAYDLERVAAYFDEVLAIVATAAEPGAQVVLGSGGARTVPDGVDRAAALDRFAQSVVIARDAAERHGLRILLEPLSRRESNLINSLREAVEFLDARGIDGVEIVADLQHMMVEDEPLAEIVALGNRIGRAHVCDTERTPPGQGTWPIAGFIEALRSGGYEGPVTIEANFTDFETELAAALAHLRGIA